MRVRPARIVEIAGLIGVDEDRVERTVVSDGGQRLERRTDQDLHTLADPGRNEVGARHSRVTWVELERPQRSISWQTVRDAQRGVASQRADLDDFARADQAHEQREQFAFGGPDLDGW